MADAIDPPELFDVEMDHFARSLTFVGAAPVHWIPKPPVCSRRAAAERD
jgi:hypothetical protein